ncbi:hypothetical protein [Mycolicibacterium fortuitum]|uniref:hypothetical protein n=1 Tax=Mycolicibacterium fortuitum TaxID=1766 RepID=UPI000A945CFE|nr:hypothetical protein [Mycolicibacterium fortuitum]
MAKPKLRRCSRCGRRARSMSAVEDWNVTVEIGVVTEVICPDCQTPLENLEAAINEATTVYEMVGGLLIGRPKAGGV